jgi:enamine deaminase RidA (YjgF/YER057c/UK114 family)
MTGSRRSSTMMVPIDRSTAIVPGSPHHQAISPGDVCSSSGQIGRCTRV